MRVLIACEFSGTVRDAFIRAGHDAMSCDLLPTESPGPHYQGDVTGILGDGWDLMIAHPPCTYLAVSGLHWNKRVPGRAEQTEKALEFVRTLLDAPIPRIALENPVSCISTRIRKPDQVIQPWWFGEDASKKTCIWLKNLPLLVPTNKLPGDEKTRRANQTPSGQNKLGPSPDRWKERSKTYPGIADAMAKQWGGDWKKVVFSADCDEDGNCPVCEIDYAECACPGPTQEDLFEYAEINGDLFARPLGAA